MHCLPPFLFTSAIRRGLRATLASNLSCNAAMRMSSTSSLVGQKLVGQSGRNYTRTKKLQSDTSKYQRSVYVAE